MRENDISGLSVLINRNEFYEQNPTTYFLRRNFATELYQHGLSLEECQYLMGHDIENENIERSDYSDINELYSLYKKINLSL